MQDQPALTATADTETINRRTPVADLPQYLSVNELQDYLRIGRSSAYEFAQKHGIRIGKLLRVPREVLTADR